MDDLDVKKCSGCLACVNVCPAGALAAAKNEERFIVPRKIAGKCVDCGLCETVCEFIHPIEKNAPLRTFAAVSVNRDVLRTSTSGGVITECAKAIIGRGGVVYGCAWTDGFIARHIRVDTMNALRKLAGSKYVQSDIGDAYRQALADLDAGKTVLFSGTPCQIAGARRAAGDRDNLYTAEVICHGVPSQDFFNDYLAYEAAKNKAAVTGFCFRDKRKGWRCAGSIELERESGRTKTKFITVANSYYYYMRRPEIYRDSCYRCPFARAERCADYWRVERFHPEIDSRNGVSLLLVNSAKGEALLRMAGGALRLYESRLENARKFNGQLSTPTPSGGKAVLADWLESGAAGALRHYKVPPRALAAEFIKDLLPQRIKKLLKKVI